MSKPLQQLRQLMQQHDVDFYFVPSADEHFNEYLPAAWERRAFITGFTGSAGDALIGLQHAYLWTDPRYFLQAEQQLDAQDFQIMRQQQGMAAPIHEWLQDNAQEKRVGVDPKLISIAQARRWQHALHLSQGKLVTLETNLIDQIWEDQPTLTANPITVLDALYAGNTAKQKITQVREALQQQGTTAHVLTKLDAVMWLYNIRGTDIEFNPLAICYAVITLDHAYLYIKPEQLNDNVTSYLQAQGITVKPLAQFAQDCERMTHTVLLDDEETSLWVEYNLANATIQYGPSPITLMKAVKNPTEIAGMHEAHRKDAIAVCRFLNWLEQNWQGQTELTIEQKLADLRAEDGDFRGLSFSTIPGYADHGAIIHYKPTEESAAEIGDQSLLLVDSGGQYLQGTTDITRTMHLGTPTPEHCQHYTLVLKGHLALRHTTFPKGTTGEQLNTIAHRPLWNEQLDFAHGTGHGVGCYLCVHEGPQRISSATTGVALQTSMVVSNEPGVYFNGQYGIRIENLCAVVEVCKSGATGHGPFYTFEDLTKVPYARNLIDKNLLTTKEVEQINQYHQQVYKLLADSLSGDDLTWLEKATQPL